MKRILLAAIFCSYIVPAFGQIPAGRPAFEVASIKLAKDADGSDSESTPGRLRMQGSLKSLIRIAYGITLDQIEGGPKWLDDDHFEIDAKADGPAETPQLYEMLQTLLADRFKLQFHKESKSTPGFALLPVKGGLKMTEAAPGDSHSTSGGRGSMTGKNVSMERLAMRLSNLLGQHVADETGNSGFFDFQLSWAPEGEAATDNSRPSIFTALQEQLGLRLEPRKVSIEMFVIDHADKPTLN